MGNLGKSLLKLVKDPSVTSIEISAAPPFVTLVFSKTEMQALLQGHALASETLARQFVRRRVFWEDIRKERHEAVLRSLQEAETQLDDAAEKFGRQTEPGVIALGKFVRAWATATSLVRKALQDRLREIDEEKGQILGYESAGEDRFDALQESLVALRRRIYPLIAVLIVFLPSDDPTRSDAEQALDRGLNMIADAALQRDVIPDIEGT